MATEYLEVAVPAGERRSIRRWWKKAGCRCLRKPWAEPWIDHEHDLWYTYHFMDCPVVTRVGLL